MDARTRELIKLSAAAIILRDMQHNAPLQKQAAGAGWKMLLAALLGTAGSTALHNYGYMDDIGGYMNRNVEPQINQAWNASNKWVKGNIVPPVNHAISGITNTYNNIANRL